MQAHLVVINLFGTLSVNLFTSLELANDFVKGKMPYPEYPKSINIPDEGIVLLFTGQDEQRADLETFESYKEAQRYQMQYDAEEQHFNGIHFVMPHDVKSSLTQ